MILKMDTFIAPTRIVLGLIFISAPTKAQSDQHNDYLPLNFNEVTIKTEVILDNKCSELFSTSLEIECIYEKNATACDERMLDGTIAKFKCKDSYYVDSMPFTEVQCINGKWSQPLFNCNPGCGKKTSKGTPLVIKGASAEIGDFPWHIGLYRKSEEKYSYICGGSIFTPKLVVSAAHCFIGSLEPREYHVTAGKIYREWIHSNDKYAQYREVVEIIIPKEYKAEKTGFAADIAVLVLDQVFLLSNLVLPVCIDYQGSSLDPIDKIFGKVAGWGLTEEGGELSDHLQYATLPLIDHEKCLATVPDDFTQHVTLDKVCAGYTNGTSVCEGDSGGGLVRETKNDRNETVFFLIGAVSTSPFKEDSCHSFQYTTFTNVEKHIAWLNMTKFNYDLWSPYDYGCILPDPPTFATYVQLNTDESATEELKPGHLVPHYTKLQYSCDPGFEIQGRKTITCKDKAWNVLNSFPTCFRTCPKLSSSDLVIDYSYDYTSKPIGDSYLHETRAIFRCNDSLNYELQKPAYNLTTCRDGRWTRPLLKCVSICGRNDGIESSPSDDVAYAREGQYPWHVGVYKHVNNNFILKCAGTILSAFVVMIDANCVDRQVLHRYLVIAGNTNSSPMYIGNHFQRTQIYKVLREDRKTILSSELLILKRRLKLSNFIRPVCLIEPDVRSSQSVLEIPFWVDGDDNLKSMTVEEMGACTLQHLYCSMTIPNDNGTNVIFGRTVRLSDTSKGKRYYLLGYKTEGPTRSEITVQTTFFRDISSFETVIDKYNVNSDIMSECVFPEHPPNAIINNELPKPGDIILEATRVSYVCKVSEYETYNSTSMLCSNGNWIYPEGEPPMCITAGTSSLIDSKRVISETGNPYWADVNAFPWHVALYNKTYGRPEYFCAGTLVTSNIVLTVGKCFTKYMQSKYINENKYVVAAGLLDWQINFERNTHVQYAEIHEIQFVGISSSVCILILNKRFKITPQVVPIRLDFHNIIPRSVKVPFAIYTPFWLFTGNANDSKLQFVYINKRFVDGKLIENADVNTTYCPNDDLWKNVKGSGSALEITVDGRKQFFVDGLLSFTNCAINRFYYRSLRSIMDQLTSTIANQNIY